MLHEPHAGVPRPALPVVVPHNVLVVGVRVLGEIPLDQVPAAASVIMQWATGNKSSLRSTSGIGALRRFFQQCRHCMPTSHLSSALKRSSMWILSILREYRRMGCRVSVRVSRNCRNSLGICAVDSVSIWRAHNEWLK